MSLNEIPKIVCARTPPPINRAIEHKDTLYSGQAIYVPVTTTISIPIMIGVPSVLKWRISSRAFCGSSAPELTHIILLDTCRVYVNTAQLLYSTMILPCCINEFIRKNKNAHIFHVLKNETITEVIISLTYI